MADILSFLTPYAAYTWVDPDVPGDPYFTLGFICPKRISHGVARRLIYGYEFQHDEASGESICIRHEAGDFILYGSNLSSVPEHLPEISDLVVFNPAFHQPVADSSAAIFTRMEVKRFGQRYPHLARWIAERGDDS